MSGDDAHDLLRLARRRDSDALCGVGKQQERIAGRDGKHLPHFYGDDDLALRPDLDDRHEFPRRKGCIWHDCASNSYNVYN